jgi:hypothetical protein
MTNQNTPLTDWANQVLLLARVHLDDERRPMIDRGSSLFWD